MKKIKHWLIERILPVWARAELVAENESLRRENESLRQKIALQTEYIAGLQWGVRAQRRVVIDAREVKK